MENNSTNLGLYRTQIHLYREYRDMFHKKEISRETFGAQTEKLLLAMDRAYLEMTTAEKIECNNMWEQ